ncbi:uncharacterized protein yc1106_08227 [Curvularia clavata]|uniref:DJ-1/PfpI domain-containing protein n=1 Tax=Curvularia clavata TaxID=95742 RepID=A0A9Q8ZHR0_CURCL|nr:uncharacterized protein yc1106_08227 [Curvularia clavata]
MRYHYSSCFNAVTCILFLTPCWSSPTQPPITNTTILPAHYGLVLFSHYQALDIFGPMDILNTIFMTSNATTTPALSVLSRNMDPVTSAMMPGGFGQEIVPTTTFKQYLCEYPLDNNAIQRGCNATTTDGRTANKPPIDVLIIPGGGGTRRDVSEEIAFVAATYPNLKYIISICTGATLLSRAGVLSGRRATTNKRSWAFATSHGQNITWVPTARWVEDGNVFTSSGVSAGIDAMYAFVSRVYGEEMATFTSLSLEYNRVVRWDDDPFAAVWDVPGAT